jgi:1-acyl-sn-glycerol-3-phosphate acyltransferase
MGRTTPEPKFMNDDQLDATMRARFVEAVGRNIGEDLEAKINGIRVYENEVGVDPFGFDRDTSRWALAAAAWLHRRYFRCIVRGIENVPDGPVLIVANHSGQVPIDGMMIGASLMLDAHPPRFPRSMVERWTVELPFVSTFFPRVGQVLGSPENARRLLHQGECIVVFPEGAKGISKTFKERYQLKPFGLGFMRLALETNTPIVPVSVVGAEEQYISIANLERFGSLIGMPALPVIPQLFLGMPLPLPTRYRICFGEPLRFEGDPDADDVVIESKVSVVRDQVAEMIARDRAARRSIFF